MDIHFIGIGITHVRGAHDRTDALFDTAIRTEGIQIIIKETIIVAQKIRKHLQLLQQ